jgi:hypothetical protein
MRTGETLLHYLGLIPVYWRTPQTGKIFQRFIVTGYSVKQYKWCYTHDRYQNVLHDKLIL